MNISGVSSAAGLKVYSVASGPQIGGPTMALMIFRTFCVLGCTFIIFVLFKRTYDQKTRRSSRRLAERTNREKGQTPQFFLVLRKKPLRTKLAAGGNVSSASTLNGSLREDRQRTPRLKAVSRSDSFSPRRLKRRRSPTEKSGASSYLAKQAPGVSSGHNRT
jgi:hypothetical protein